MNQVANVRLTTEQSNYLSHLSDADSSFATLLRSHPNLRIEDGIVSLDRTEARIIADFFGDRLAELGFDENYEPNEEGILLEGLIDALFPVLSSSE